MTDNLRFHRWLTKCANLAMRSEWVIDYNMPEWLHWYRAKLSPQKAVDELWKLIKENEDKVSRV